MKNNTQLRGLIFYISVKLNWMNQMMQNNKNKSDFFFSTLFFDYIVCNTCMFLFFDKTQAIFEFYWKKKFC